MLNFKEWLLTEGDTSAKTGLYPSAYQGISQYPPAYLLPASADALYYMSMDNRFYLGSEGGPFSIKHIPGQPSHKRAYPGEGAPWNIKHIPGKPTHHQTGENGAKPGDGSPWSIKHIPK